MSASTDLARELSRRADELGRRVIADMYRNPFWEARFGARGRKFADEDGRYHVTYLVEALSAGDAGVLTKYATWLRTVLVTRGMCTRHLADNYERLAAAIGDLDGLEGKELARSYLHAAVAALDYGEGAPAALQRHTPVLARAIARRLYAAHPEWSAAGEARCADDIVYHLSYLTDAVAVARPELFVAYVLFIAEFLELRGVAHAHTAETFALVDSELAALDAATHAAAAPILASAAAALAAKGATP